MVLEKVFPVDQITIRSYGNSLTAIGDLRGLVADEFTMRELQYADESFAVEVAARARKEGEPARQQLTPTLGGLGSMAAERVADQEA